MARRLQEQKVRSRENHASSRRATETGATRAQAPQHEDLKHEDLKHELDDLLDDIDAVLEENAEEFVAAYVQRGGQ
jgi:prokaryotic ubiquitin-like protein Pup